MKGDVALNLPSKFEGRRFIHCEKCGTEMGNQRTTIVHPDAHVAAYCSWECVLVEVKDKLARTWADKRTHGK